MSANRVRRLIVNADDFGLTPDVNRGIVEACRRGVLRSTTLMANGGAFADAVALAKQEPKLDVGAHLVLVGGESVARPGVVQPRTVGQLLRGLPSRDEIEAELAAQMEKIQDAGVRITHVDTHKHTHLLPRVLDAVVAVARRYGTPWVRRPFDLPLTAAASGSPFGRRVVSRCLRPLDRRFQKKLSAAGLRSTDYFAGFQITGLYRAGELAQLIRALPEGTTELMTHPGFCGAELRAMPTRLKESRERELEALVSADVLAAVEEAGVEIASFDQP